MNEPRPNDIENLLDTLTGALLANQRWTNLFTVTEATQVEPFIALIRQLKHGYRPQRANRRYTARLHHELMGQDFTVVERVRYLPPPIQIAACIAILGTLLVLMRGRASLSAGQAGAVLSPPVEVAS